MKYILKANLYLESNKCEVHMDTVKYRKLIKLIDSIVIGLYTVNNITN